MGFAPAFSVFLVSFTLSSGKISIAKRPRTYGEKVKLKSLFSSCAAQFSSKIMTFYGKPENVRFLCMDLLWRPVGRLCRFMLVKIGNVPFVLMFSDLTLTPEEITKAKQATEAFVCLSLIATGILTLIGFDHNREIWDRYSGFLRTIRSPIPSLATTKLVISQDFCALLPHLFAFPAFNFIPKLQRSLDFLYRCA